MRGLRQPYNVLEDLKKRVKPEKLDVSLQGMRETRSNVLLVELKCSAENRERLSSVFSEVLETF